MNGSSTARPVLLCIILAAFLLVMPGILQVSPGQDRSVNEKNAQPLRPRGMDSEPGNGDPSGASEMFNDEIVGGSIMVTAPDDFIDWYFVDVPAGNAVNLSLGQWQFNSTYPDKYNLQMLLGYDFQGELMWVDIAWTEGAWESVSYYTPVDRVFFIAVISNLTANDVANSAPTNYSLGVHWAKPFQMMRDSPLGTAVDLTWAKYTDIWLRLNHTPETDELLYFYTEFDTTVDIDVFVYQVWPYEPDFLFLLNASQDRGVGLHNKEYMEFGGSEGDYLIRISTLGGQGNIAFVVRNFTNTWDSDNIKKDAVAVTDNYEMVRSLEQAVDHYDWFFLKLLDGEIISKIRFKITEGDWRLYRVDILDESGTLLDHKYNTLTGGLPNEENPTTVGLTFYDFLATYTGKFYVVVRGIGTLNLLDDPWFKPAKCEYSLTFTLPNNPPEVVGSIPQVQIIEDTEFSGLDLKQYFTDPDGDELTYSLGRLTQNLDVMIDKDTGMVTIVPEPNWFGTEAVCFRATDNGPGRKFVETWLTVDVEQVNDIPERIGGANIQNITISEDQLGFTPQMAALFNDPDQHRAKPLEYTIQVISANLTPSGSTLPIPVYNSTSDRFEIGPASGLFGSAVLKITADDRNGTPAEDLPSAGFNLTILHVNHPPTVKPGAGPVVAISLVEGEYNQTCSVWDYIVDKDTQYANDTMEFSVSGPVFLDAGVLPSGCLWFDARKEFFPGQNYKENLVLTVTDSFGETVSLTFEVTIEPVDDPPEMISHSPAGNDTVLIDEGAAKEFRLVVTDPDTQYKDMNFTWYLDGKKRDDWNTSIISYQTDFDSADGSEHILFVEVTSGVHKIDAEWTLIVRDVNRAPDGVAILTPVNSTQFEKGDEVGLSGEGTDPDGDELTFTWYEQGQVIGTGSSVQAEDLGPGIHIVTLEVSDGEFSTSTTVVFEVTRPSEQDGIPGFEVVIMIAAVLGALGASGAIGTRRRWRR